MLAPKVATYFLGNSQLIYSVVAAYCSPEVLAEAHVGWGQDRVSGGEMLLENGRPAVFLSCNMVMLAHVWQLQEFLDLVDPDATTIVAMLRGNEFAYESLVDAEPRWDFIYDGRLADSSRLFVQTEDAVAHFDASTAGLCSTMLLIRERFPRAAVYCVAAPPPLEPSSSYLAADDLGTLAELARAHGLRPFALRRKIYDVMYDRLADRLRTGGVEMLFAPAECLTDAGALRHEYAADFVHGNARYGRAIVRQLEEHERDASVHTSA